MLTTLSMSCYRHRWRALLAWVVLLVAVIAASGAFGGAFDSGGGLRADSDRANELLSRAFPGDDGHRITIALHDERGIDRAPARAALATFRTAALRAPGVTQLSSTERTAADGRTAVASLLFDGTEEQIPAAVSVLRTAADAARAVGLEIDFADDAFVEGSLGNAELVGLAAAVVILLLAFGSVIAMGVPIVTALAGVAGGSALVGLWAAVVTTPDFTSEISLMIGLGVGIDYALVIVTRYREALAHGRAPGEAIAEAMGTAGRSVVFAGTIVMLSLLGMLLIGLPFLRGLALASASTVALAVAAAVTLVPAVLAILPRRVGRRAQRRVTSTRETLWHRWSRFVQRRATRVAVGGTVLLVGLAAPVTAMRLAHADLGNTEPGSTTRIAYDRIGAAFGAGVQGPLVVALPLGDGTDATRVAALAARVRGIEGVAAVSSADVSPDATAARIVVIPSTGPQDRRTASLVHRLRADLRDGAQVEAHVGGATASDVDFADIMARRLPLFIGSVLAASFVVLLLVFRSVLVSLKAVLMNLLSIAAAYGAMVMVFQWGWGASLIGLHSRAPIEPWAPMMLFAIVFGLSMDYEVFLLSAVQEHYRRTHDNSTAVVEGLARTARVITAAAAIMAAVFGAFVANDLRGVKLIGFGLATAVVVDATVVRMLLVPATMELLGARNWWMPRWLDRLLPALHLEDPTVQVGRSRHAADAARPGAQSTGGARTIVPL